MTPQSPRAFHLQKHDRQFLLSLAALLVLYILPIILADFYYADDIGRSVSQTPVTWNSNGRILGTLLYSFLSWGAGTDISPLSQILAGGFLLFSGYLLFRLYFYHLPPFLASGLAFLFIASPFFLSNLSYKYDSVAIMTPSVFCSVLAHFLSTRASKRSFWWALLSLGASLLFYQPSFPVFLELSLLFIVINPLRKSPNELLRFLGKAILLALLGYLLYFEISRFWISGWILEHQKMLSFTHVQDFSTFFGSLRKISFRISSFLKDPAALVLFVPPVFLSWILSIRRLYPKTWSKSSLLLFLLTLLLPLIFYFLLLLPVIPLRDPVFLVRVLLGFTVIGLYGFLELVLTLSRSRYFKFSYLILLPVLYMLHLSYAYGNFSKSRKHFNNQVVAQFMQDLQVGHQVNKVHKVLLVGDAPLSLEQKLLLQKLPILPYLSRAFIDGSPFWNYLDHFPFFSVDEILTTDTPEGEALAAQIHAPKFLAENPIYVLKVEGDVAIIEYKVAPTSKSQLPPQRALKPLRDKGRSDLSPTEEE